MASPRSLRKRLPVVWVLFVAFSSDSVNSGVFIIPRVPSRTQTSRLSSPPSAPLAAPSLTGSSPLSTATVTRPSSGRAIPLRLPIRQPSVVRPSSLACAPARPTLRFIRPIKRSWRAAFSKTASTCRFAPLTVLPVA